MAKRKNKRRSKQETQKHDDPQCSPPIEANPLIQPSLIIVSIILFVLSFALYDNALDNGFTWDDKVTVVNNHFITDASNTLTLFSSDYLSNSIEVQLQQDSGKFKGAGEVTYRPIVTLSYILDHIVWDKDPWGYHLTNILIHGICTVLLIFFVWILIAEKLVAFLAGLLFAVHPVATETVNAISYREDSLCLLFILLSLISFIIAWRSDPKSKTRLKLAGLSAFAALLAGLSKEMAAVLPLLMFAICYLDSKRELKGNESVFLTAISGTVSYLFLYFIAFHNPSDPIGWYGQNLATHFSAILQAYSVYIQLFAMSIALNVSHNIDPPASLMNGTAVLAIVILLSFMVACYYSLRKKCIGGFGLLWIVITMLPVSGIIPLRHLAAERYLYVPLAGYVIFLAWIIYLLSNKISGENQKGRAIVALLLVGAPVAYGSMLVRDRNPDWKDPQSLWSSSLESNPKSAMAAYQMGKINSDSKNWEEAITYFKQAADLISDKKHSKYAHSRLGIAGAYLELKDYDNALRYFKQITDAVPNHVDALNMQSRILMRQKKFSEARPILEKLVSVHPNHALGLYNLGRVRIIEKRDREAIPLFRRSLKLNPNNARCRKMLTELEARFER